MTDTRLLYIPTELTRLKAIASDYEWDGDEEAARLVWDKVAELQKQVKEQKNETV